MPGKTVAQLEAALDAEIKRMQTELVGTPRLQKAKNQAAASFYMSMDSIFYRGMLLGRTETVAHWTLLKEFIPKIQQVTAEDRSGGVAKKYLVPENCTVGILVPVKTGKPEAAISIRPEKSVREFLLFPGGCGPLFKCLFNQDYFPWCKKCSKIRIEAWVPSSASCLVFMQYRLWRLGPASRRGPGGAGETAQRPGVALFPTDRAAPGHPATDHQGGRRWKNPRGRRVWPT